MENSLGQAGRSERQRRGKVPGGRQLQRDKSVPTLPLSASLPLISIFLPPPVLPLSPFLCSDASLSLSFSHKLCLSPSICLAHSLPLSVVRSPCLCLPCCLSAPRSLPRPVSCRCRLSRAGAVPHRSLHVARGPIDCRRPPVPQHFGPARRSQNKDRLFVYVAHCSVANFTHALESRALRKWAVPSPSTSPGKVATWPSAAVAWNMDACPPLP